VGIHHVQVASNGQQALDAMRAHLPDLVVSAMYFEDMSGPELIGAIRTDDALADVPFMLVSGERHAHNLEPMRQAGILAILPKPFAVADLKTALYACLDHIELERLDLTDPNMDSLRVLVVDDSEFATKHIVQLLQRMGFRHIQTASNGRTAAEAIRDQHFSLVITDYHMPEMDGEQLVNYIRHLSEQPDMPILMITAEQDSARLASVRQSGVSALLDKPFDATTIQEIRQRLLRAEAQAL
jgi:two-component system chemotaxis response regulator CheY